jgi:hypothetical protein
MKYTGWRDNGFNVYAYLVGRPGVWPLREELLGRRRLAEGDKVISAPPCVFCMENT